VSKIENRQTNKSFLGKITLYMLEHIVRSSLRGYVRKLEGEKNLGWYVQKSTNNKE